MLNGMRKPVWKPMASGSPHTAKSGRGWLLPKWLLSGRGEQAGRDERGIRSRSRSVGHPHIGHPGGMHRGGGRHRRSTGIQDNGDGGPVNRQAQLKRNDRVSAGDPGSLVSPASPGLVLATKVWPVRFVLGLVRRARGKKPPDLGNAQGH